MHIFTLGNHLEFGNLEVYVKEKLPREWHLIKGFRAKRVYIAFRADFHFLQDRAKFWQTDWF